MPSKPLPVTLDKCWPIEKRVLGYLDQQGMTRHLKLVGDLASPDSRIGRGIMNGSNSFVAAHAARWTSRLRKEGLVKLNEHLSHYHTKRGDRRTYIVHDGYSITPAGKKFLREGKR